MTDDEDGVGFDAWYVREAPRLLALVTLAVGDRWLAEEATAEAFARALERWPAVRAKGSPSAWVYTVALNQVRSTIRRRSVERRFVLRHRAPPGVAPAPEPDVALWQAVAQLPQRERLMVVFRYVGDLPEADIARALGVTRGTVSSTLSRARQRLAHTLSATHGGTSS
jgi:RNA polymerase sigma-70 factor (ECF subfamily)